MTGSTFTITNPGPLSSYASSPIINQPNVGILCTDGVKRRPVAVDGDLIAVHPVGIIGLVYDHRAFDGVTASRFLLHIRETLEQRDWAAELAWVGERQPLIRWVGVSSAGCWARPPTRLWGCVVRRGDRRRLRRLRSACRGTDRTGAGHASCGDGGRSLVCDRGGACNSGDRRTASAFTSFPSKPAHGAPGERATAGLTG